MFVRLCILVESKGVEQGGAGSNVVEISVREWREKVERVEGESRKREGI